MPFGPGQTSPAAMPTDMAGKQSRGRVVAGLGIEMLRIAMSLFPPTSDEGVALAEHAAKLGKLFGKPPADLGQAELKFMGSQMYPMQRPQAMDMGPQVRSSLAGAGVPPPQPTPAGAAPGGPTP